MNEVSETERAERHYAKRRHDIEDQMRKRLEDPTWITDKTLPNPKVTSEMEQNIARARFFAWQFDDTVYFPIVVMGAFITFAILSGLNSWAIVGVGVGVVWALISAAFVVASQRYSKLNALLARHKPRLKLADPDLALALRFGGARDKIMACSPTDAMLASITEAQSLFEDLLVSASEFEAAGLAHTKAARDNRDQMLAFTADMSCLSEVAEERHALALKVESIHGYQAVENARTFPGLLAAGASASLETDSLKETLKEIS